MEKRGRESFKKFLFVFSIMSAFYKLFPLKYRIYLLNKSGKRNGKIALGIRYALLRSIAKKCGENVAIFNYCTFVEPQNLEIGNNVSIQPMCYIDASGGLTIGNDVSIAHGVSILTSSHEYKSYEKAIRDQGLNFKKTEIKNNVWIGAKATILYGVTIAKGTIIGCNAVVNKDYREDYIIAGIPAREINKR